MHIHAAPVIVPRLLDDFELAAAARAAGMAAIVLKSHHMLTADRAQIAQKSFPEVKVFGGLALNLPACGGLYPEAVKVALRMGAKIIWLPTLSAVNHIDRTKTRVTGNLGVMSQGFAARPVHVVGADGAAAPELVEILQLIAAADVTLLRALCRALSRPAEPGYRARRRGARVVERTRLLQPCPQPACRRTNLAGPARRNISRQPRPIAQLPGIGRSTAAAIAALAFGQRAAILDGSVKRVLARHGGVGGWPGDKKVETALWQLAESHLPHTAIEAYTQGVMDLGVLICTRSQPVCQACPISTDCIAFTQHRTAELPTPRPRKPLPERQEMDSSTRDHSGRDCRRLESND